MKLKRVFLFVLISISVGSIIIFSCSIEGPFEVPVNFYLNCPAIIIGKPVAVIDSINSHKQYYDMKIVEWIWGIHKDTVIRFRDVYGTTSCGLRLLDTTKYYCLPLFYYGKTAEESLMLSIPSWPDAIVSSDYLQLPVGKSKTDVDTLPIVKIVRHIVEKKSHAFTLSLIKIDSVFTPAKMFRVAVTITNVSRFELTAPPEDDIDFSVHVFDGPSRAMTYEGRLRDGIRKRIDWIPSIDYKNHSMKSGESKKYLVDISQRFTELASFSNNPNRSLKIIAVLNYAMSPLYMHSVRSDTVHSPFGVVNDIESQTIPATFQLYQNYPNPFSKITNVDFRRSDHPRIPSLEEGKLTFKVFDIFGCEVLNLSNEVIHHFTAANLGSSIVIQNSDLPSPGIYFYRLTINNQVQTKKLLFVR